MPILSIAIPTYKRPDLLHEAIESVLSQDSPIPYELIVVDNDQSKDILDVVSSFSPSKIAVYQNLTNIGLWGNMQRVLELSKGKWILTLCDDDLLMPDTIEKFAQIILSHKDEAIGCVAGGVELLLSDEIKPLFNTIQPRIQFPLAKSLYLEGSLRCVEDHLALKDTPKLCSSFFNREYIMRLGGWDAECHGFADLALFLKIQKDRKLFTCNEVFGRFRQHSDNESHKLKLWNTYPIHAGQRVLSCYVDGTTPLGKNIGDMIERMYISALWRGYSTREMRKAYAKDVLQLIVQNPRRQFLLKNTWFLDILGLLYTTLRPILGWLSQRILGSRYKQAANTGTREVS